MATGKLELVLSRSCKHLDWCYIPDTYIEFCKRCGFALLNFGSQPSANVFNQVQSQPKPETTFTPTHNPQFGSRGYVYKPLDLDRREIRLLHLKAGHRCDPISCELEHVNLQHGPVYEALSYTWADESGDDALCRTIECGPEKKLLAITKNCEAALRRLRKLDADRSLWVDAICIDQSSIEERNHQVKNMINIFRGAIRVVVFLGEGNHRLTRLVGYISSDSDGQLPRIFEFLKLFQSRWFHRIWVLQEVAVSKSAVVIYGDKQVSWEDLLNHSLLYTRLMTTRDHMAVLPPVVMFALQPATSDNSRPQRKLDMVSMLQVSRNCSCKDARDKVYAILGLLRNEAPFPLRADYSSSVSAGWVFLQAAAHDIVTKGSLEILSHVDGVSSVLMPSWVPDWTMKSPRPLPLQLKPMSVSFCPCIVSYDHCEKDGSPFSMPDYNIHSTLQVRGQRYGTVWMDQLMFTETEKWDDYKRLKQRESHWLFNHSPSSATRSCWKGKEFWKSILSVCPSVNVDGIDVANNEVEHAGIPPAFGGMCQGCHERDVDYNSYFRKSAPDCSCRDLRPHFDRNELERFMSIVKQYGENRRIFGTDHSLGIGPVNMRNEDEIWVVEGSEVPLILRPIKLVNSEADYVLIGACFVHALTRTIDQCCICYGRSSRTHITLGQESHDFGEQLERQESPSQPLDEFVSPTTKASQDLRLKLQQLPCQDTIINIR